MFTGTEPHHMQPSPDGSLNFNMEEHRWEMITELDGQLRQPRMIVAMLSKHW